MVKKLAIVFGIVFVVVGLLGFISNPIVGDAGIFHTNALHNIVHLLVGIILLCVAKNEKNAAKAMKIFGIVYLLLAILGFISLDILSFISANGADNILHLVLGIVLLVVGMKASKGAPMKMSSPMTPPTSGSADAGMSGGSPHM